MLKIQEDLSVTALRVAAVNLVNEDMNRWRFVADRQLELQKALHSNLYLIWSLQLIARCKQDLLYSSCDLIDFEVAREGVEYEDELEYSPKPLVDFRLQRIQAMTLLEKQAITEHLCLLGYKVTLCGDDLGTDHQLECPLLINFNKECPSTPNAKRFNWKVLKISEQNSINSPSSLAFIKSLQSIGVVTNARVFTKYDRLMSIVRRRQTFLEHICSNMYCLWALELLILCVPIRKCLHVDQNLIASAGVGRHTVVDTQHSTVTNNVDVGDLADDNELCFYGDPIYFSRICKLERMTDEVKRSIIPLLNQFKRNWNVVKIEGGNKEVVSRKEYLFSVHSAKI